MFLLSIMNKMWSVKTGSGECSYPTADLGLKKEAGISPNTLYAPPNWPIAAPGTQFAATSKWENWRYVQTGPEEWQPHT